jgi:hypothetical protein
VKLLKTVKTGFYRALTSVLSGYVQNELSFKLKLPLACNWLQYIRGLVSRAMKLIARGRLAQDAVLPAGKEGAVGGGLN